MTVPKTFIEQNHLREGSQVDLLVAGAPMTVNAPRRPRYKLEDSMAEMAVKLPRVDGWDEMIFAGKERA
jgi:antitoxin ChpS